MDYYILGLLLNKNHFYYQRTLAMKLIDRNP